MSDVTVFPWIVLCVVLHPVIYCMYWMLQVRQ